MIVKNNSRKPDTFENFWNPKKLFLELLVFDSTRHLKNKQFDQTFIKREMKYCTFKK
jgi:hypothetical protein